MERARQIREDQIGAFPSPCVEVLEVIELPRDERRSRTESCPSHRRKGLTGPLKWPRHGPKPGDGTRVSPEARGPLRLHPREPGRDRQCPRDHPGLVGGDPRCSDHFGRDARRARRGVDRDGGRRLHLDAGPTAALSEPSRPGAAGDGGSPANGTGRGPRDPRRVGLQGRRYLEEIVERICRNPTAELEFMMSFELKLSPVEAGAPRASAFLVGTATVVGHFIPLSPFFFVGSDVLLGAVVAVLLSGVALFGIGWYEAKITVGSWWREGLEMLVIGLGGGVAGYVIGRLVGAA